MCVCCRRHRCPFFFFYIHQQKVYFFFFPPTIRLELLPSPVLPHPARLNREKRTRTHGQSVFEKGKIKINKQSLLFIFLFWSKDFVFSSSRERPISIAQIKVKTGRNRNRILQAVKFILLPSLPTLQVPSFLNLKLQGANPIKKLSI